MSAPIFGLCPVCLRPAHLSDGLLRLTCKCQDPDAEYIEVRHDGTRIVTGSPFKTPKEAQG